MASGPECGPLRIAFTEITLRSDRREDTARFEAAIGTFDAVLECFRVAGHFDYLVKYVVTDESASQRLASKLRASGLGIVSCRSRVMRATVFVRNSPGTGSRLGYPD